MKMYSVLGTIVYAAMSADASCLGLRSPRDGPIIMEFTQGQYGIVMPPTSVDRGIIN